jgi:hypothetical protein
LQLLFATFLSLWCMFNRVGGQMLSLPSVWYLWCDQLCYSRIVSAVTDLHLWHQGQGGIWNCRVHICKVCVLMIGICNISFHSCLQLVSCWPCIYHIICRGIWGMWWVVLSLCWLG